MSNVVHFFLDQASNQALKEEINRLNAEVNHLNAESRSLNSLYDERGLQIQTVKKILDLCESKNRNHGDNCKFLSLGDFLGSISLEDSRHLVYI